MHILRKFLLWVSVSLLPLTLFGFGLALSLQLVIGQPQPVKGAVASSGLYDVLVDDLLLQNQTTIANLPLSDSGIKTAIDSAFTPTLLKQTGNNIIDGSYAWLQGKTTTPQFNVDLSNAKATAAENVATYVANRAAGLAVCSTAGLQQEYASGALDNPYTLTCRPASLSIQAIHDEVDQSILGSTDFLKDATLTAATVQDTDGQPLYKKLNILPKVYQDVQKSVWGLGIVALLTSLGVIFINPIRRGGLKHWAIVLITVGGISTALALVSNFVATYLSKAIAKASDGSQGLQVKIADILRIIVSDVRHWWLGFAIAEIVIGISLLVWLGMTRKRLSIQPAAGLSSELTNELPADNLDTFTTRRPL